MESKSKNNVQTKLNETVDSVIQYREMNNNLNLKTKLFYSLGHIYNDLCASIWFSYTLLYFKLSFNDTTAGLLLLLGQVADAISTPLIGFLSDKNISIFGNYGRRKVWHLIGSIIVTCSFPLIFNSCMICSVAEQWEKFYYYSIFIILFQFGWASVQVSHLSLITDLTEISSERVELNAFRQAASVASSICVYTITLLLLGIEDSTITKNDSIVFMKVVHLITLIGIIFSALFHVFVKEPNHEPTFELKYVVSSSNENEISHKESIILEQGFKLPEMKQVKNVPIESSRNTRKWFNWFGSISFWKICVIYMMSRLYVNVTQVYTPLYLQETLQLAKRNIAIVPFITYFAGFVFSLLSKSKQINAKIIMCIGCFFSLISCVWIWYSYLQISIWEVFIMASIFGIGGTLMLIGSLSLTSDLIGINKISGAFVYGSMSFFDKLINGAVIALVQHLKPTSNSNIETLNLNGTILNNSIVIDIGTFGSNSNDSIDQSILSPISNNVDVEPTVFYLHVLSFVSGAAVIITFLTLTMIMRKEISKLIQRFIANNK
ncbi:hypothetical protein BLOT_005776 [Blomia tropicalis]|nr:hypothetical protein BLOT_005776 [Blomia tropicalis]